MTVHTKYQQKTKHHQKVAETAESEWQTVYNRIEYQITLNSLKDIKKSLKRQPADLKMNYLGIQKIN